MAEYDRQKSFTNDEYIVMFHILLEKIESNELLEYLYTFCHEMAKGENKSRQY